MKYYTFFALLAPIFLSGCGAISSSKAERHQMELSLHKVRTEVDELKHDLNTYEIEHHILEGQLIDQQQSMEALKQQITSFKQENFASFSDDLQKIEKNVARLSKQQEKAIGDIRQLSSHANDTTTALSQYKAKIAQLEKSISLEKEQLKEITKKVYVVQVGDSLEKIARNHNISLEELKKYNPQLASDLIVVDQEIHLP